MSDRPEKKALIKEVQQQLEASEYTILADCRGMKVEKLTELRGKLRGAQSRLMIAKNGHVALASSELGWADFEALLTGPTAVITGGGDVSEVAKVLKEFAKDSTLPVMKGGRFAERTLSMEDVAAIASLPPREVLLGQVVGTIAAPLSQLVGVLNQKVLSLLYVLQAVSEKKSQQD